MHAHHQAPRDGLILAVNSGSSSLKISLYARGDTTARATRQQSGRCSDGVELLLTSSTTNISSPPATFSFQLVAHASGREVKKEPMKEVTDHNSAFSHFLDYLRREARIDRERIVHVCHRVVHGGDFFEPVIIDKATFSHIERLSDLAPL